MLHAEEYRGTCVLEGENHAKIPLCYEYDFHGIKGSLHEQLDIY